MLDSCSGSNTKNNLVIVTQSNNELCQVQFSLLTINNVNLVPQLSKSNNSHPWISFPFNFFMKSADVKNPKSKQFQLLIPLKFKQKVELWLTWVTAPDAINEARPQSETRTKRSSSRRTLAALKLLCMTGGWQPSCKYLRTKTTKSVLEMVHATLKLFMPE